MVGGGEGYVTVGEGNKGYNRGKCLDNTAIENRRLSIMVGVITIQNLNYNNYVTLFIL